MKQLHTINLEDPPLTVEEARKKLIREIDQARKEKYRFVKIIHGHGSHGVGGAIKAAVPSSLRKRRKEGLILDYLPGENNTMFDEVGRNFRQKYPEFQRYDPSVEANKGITIAVLGYDGEEN